MAEVRFAYGSDFISLDLPRARVIAELKPDSRVPSSGARALVQEALAHPVGLDGNRPGEIVRPVPTTLVLPDKTRNCGAHLFLPHLLDFLNEVGISDREVTILLANGSHVSNSNREIANMLGEETVSRVRILEHDSHDEATLILVGETCYRNPVKINRHVAGAEQVICVATAVHHYFAGYGGGPKMINPGCAGYHTIAGNHALSIDGAAKGLHPACRSGNVEGNPIQEDIRDSFRFIRKPLLLETVLDAHGDIVAAFWGELWRTHQLACDLVDEIYRVRLDEPADLVVASCGGAPKDINLIQAHKSIANAFQAVKPRGVILLFARCPQGIGSETFMEWFSYHDFDSMMRALSLTFKLNGTTALSLRSKAKAVTIVLVSELAPEILEKIGLRGGNSVAEAWQEAASMLPENYTCVMMPNASLTLPEVNR